MATTLKTELLDQKMTEVFDWSNDQMPLRYAMWNHVMDDNGHDTMKTIAEAKKWENMNDAELKKTAEQMLK